jgi:hypothetical protein
MLPPNRPLRILSSILKNGYQDARRSGESVGSRRFLLPTYKILLCRSCVYQDVRMPPNVGLARCIHVQGVALGGHQYSVITDAFLPSVPHKQGIMAWMSKSS